MDKSRGFSLVELMIVIVIMGILASIAVPALTDYMIRGKIVEAKSSLADGRVRLEQWFQDNRTYVGGPCPAGTNNFGFVCNLQPATYTITATGVGQVSNFEYTINELNTRGSTTAWGNNAACWVSRRGGGC